MRTLFLILLFLCTHILGAQHVFPLTSVHGSTKEPLNIHVKNEYGDKSYLAAHLPKGRIYLVSVWATWCGSCRSELKAIQKVHCDWSEKYDLEFFAISIDAPTDHSKIFPMANTMGWDFTILHDEYGYLVKELDIFKLPRMFLIDQMGNIVYQPTGYNPNALKKLEEKIMAL